MDNLIPHSDNNDSAIYLLDPAYYSLSLYYELSNRYHERICHLNYNSMLVKRLNYHRFKLLIATLFCSYALYLPSSYI